MPSPTDGVTALRGTVVTCRDDPFLTDPATAFAVETDGVVICRDGLVEAVGSAGAAGAESPPRQIAKPASAASASGATAANADRTSCSATA